MAGSFIGLNMRSYCYLQKDSYYLGPMVELNIGYLMLALKKEATNSSDIVDLDRPITIDFHFDIIATTHLNY